MTIVFADRPISLAIVIALTAAAMLISCDTANNTPTSDTAPTTKQSATTTIEPTLGIKSIALDSNAADTTTALLANAQAVYGELQTAREAALHEDKAGFIKALGTAREALNQLPDTLTSMAAVVENADDWALFPVQDVTADLDSAAAAANNDQPYWAGALEAIQSALATFHWYGQAPSANLLAAYTDALNAYAVAAAPDFRPDQNQVIIDQLSKAAESLQNVANTADLQAATRALIDKVTPEKAEIKQLAYNIHLLITQQREQAAVTAQQAKP
ncbi:MAG: hypothetical protein BWK73_10220 [Thiothrix lacustris]|uniref:Imelysin-like domain-containing protein n=1 Tax=Thiothrix lacustris TaxID=525917 RepID=A0A1Y1QUF3_9GAMM|nr:MAG: hypothetical protein BWK73_10220 [Thiothrix lacustris]